MTFRDRLEQGRERPNKTEAIIAAEIEDGYSCDYFATDNIKSLPACLELRLPDGKSEGLPYSLITRLTYNTDSGILIKSSVINVKITGRFLRKLYDYLTAYRVRFIQGNTGTDPEEDELFVNEITIEELE